ncbi:HAD family hydrolase [Aestuariirhabdus haliotis]|uniref:HAD family hydrolase n=1 Tax=Aestuariirhabdus haliotis TaxID=2918751 RepID=UPI0020BF6AD1|nr:HAD-IA family hydrolase [Aestuariirhabdus haliotis]MCL6420123.1 HAD-IA family hydrolase [Aestuariirhabdus haliotis]
MIDAISFDLDDTLWDNRPVIRAAEAALADWVQRRAPDLVPHYQLETLLEFRREIIEEQPRLRHRISELREQILFRALRYSGYSEAEGRQLAAEGFTLFLDERHRVSPFPETEPLLELLARDYQLIALTNGNLDIARLPLGRFFDHSVRAEEIGLAKPNPEFYRTALERIGTNPARTLHIGDDLENDVIGARNAGLHALWFNPGKAPNPPADLPLELQVETLRQIPDAIGQWRQRMRDTVNR